MTPVHRSIRASLIGLSGEGLACPLRLRARSTVAPPLLLAHHPFTRSVDAVRRFLWRLWLCLDQNVSPEGHPTFLADWLPERDTVYQSPHHLSVAWGRLPVDGAIFFAHFPSRPRISDHP